MSDHAQFESLRMKARKLAALAARGVDGEREAAQAKLQAFLTRWNITLESLDAGERKTRELVCVLDPKRPKKDADLARLAWQCVKYIMGFAPEAASFLRTQQIKRPKGKAQQVRFYVHHVDMSKAEFEDWEACFQHYGPAFEATRARLRRALRAALKGFIHAQDIFPPPEDSKVSKPLAYRDAGAHRRHAQQPGRQMATACGPTSTN